MGKGVSQDGRMVRERNLRVQSSAELSVAGKKGKSVSPWRRGPHVRSGRNVERVLGWRVTKLQGEE